MFLQQEVENDLFILHWKNPSPFQDITKIISIDVFPNDMTGVLHDLR